MLSRLLRFTFVIYVVCCISNISACIWDIDTVVQEKARHPSVLELLTGKFPSHSAAYYEWRIKDRLAKLEKTPDNVALLDDLAVAYDKLGKHDKAIETMHQSLKLQPDRYESLANLGTFYFHAGKLAEGIPYIEKALVINPNAHFGREKYQLFLVRYVQEARYPQEDLPLCDMAEFKDFIATRTDDRTSFGPAPPAFPVHVWGFAKFLARENDRDKLRPEEIRPAIRGIEGMMRFGKYDSPILLEALACLLVANEKQDAKLLAAQALTCAAEKSEKGRIDYSFMAKEFLRGQSPKSIEDFQKEWEAECATAKKLHAQIAADELKWITSGIDVDAAYQRKYYRAAK